MPNLPRDQHLDPEGLALFLNTLETNVMSAEYSSSATYTIGDYCIYNNKIYRCTTAITSGETWDATHWTSVLLTDEIKSKGIVDSVKIGNTEYTPTSGVVTLPNASIKIADLAIGKNDNTSLHIISGDNIEITPESAVVSRISVAVNAKSRPIQLNGTEILGNNTTPFNLVEGSGIALDTSEGSGSVTISSYVTDTTYTFANGTNGFTVTSNSGSAQTVTVTPSIANNITGSGTSGYLTKFNGTDTITNGPQLGSSTTTYLRNDGSWQTPTDTKNTAGSTDTSSKIFLVGATSQAANPQTYSDNEVYVTSGVLTTKSIQATETVFANKFDGDVSDCTGIPTATSDLTNDSNFITAAGAPVQSVNNQTGIVMLDSADIEYSAGVNVKSKIDTLESAIPTDTNDLTNGANFITAAGAPVQSVNGQTDIVVLTGNDIEYSAGVTVSEELEDKISKTGDIITGALVADNCSFVITGPYSHYYARNNNEANVIDFGIGSGNQDGILYVKNSSGTDTAFLHGVDGSVNAMKYVLTKKSDDNTSYLANMTLFSLDSENALNIGSELTTAIEGIKVNNATSADSAATATTATKLGTSTVGGADQIVYLNSGTPTAGTSASTSATANTIAKRQGNGYLYATYFNASNGAENPASYTSYPVFKDSNGFFRMSTLANFKNWFGQANSAATATSATNATNATTATNLKGSKAGIKFYAGTTVVNPGGGDSCRLIYASTLNSYFGVSNCGAGNTALFIANGDGGAWGGHFTGCTYLSSDTSWWATFATSRSGNVRINWLAVYFG